MNARRISFWIISLFVYFFVYSSLSLANGILDRAYEQYSLRDFTPAGIKSATNAYYNYDRMKYKLSDLNSEYARTRALQALVFVANADKSSRQFYINQGFGEANSAYLSYQSKYGREPFSSGSLSLGGKKVYADFLYWAAKVSAEWIRDQGGSLANEKQKIISNMEKTISNGFGCLNAGGAFHLIGELDPSRSPAMFESAYKCAPWSGVAVLSLANLYDRQNQRDRAIAILKTFLSKPPADWSMELIPENIRDQKVAIEILYSWGARPRPESIPGEFVVQLKSNLGPQILNRKFLNRSLPKRLKAQIKSWISDDIIVVTKPLIQTQESSLLELSKDEIIQHVEPNFIYKKSSINDPLASNQWAIQNLGQLDPKGQVGYPGIDTNLVEAWKITTGSPQIVVAVIDTGIDIQHPDLISNIWTNEKELKGKMGIDDDQNGFIDDIHGWDFIKNKPLEGDDEGHGTHCAGVIGATGNNGIGIAGVNWKVKLMGLKFLDSKGGGSLETAIKALKYATKMGVQITSNSWGGGGYSEILKETIAEQGRLGILFVGAAGNSGENADVIPEFPSGYPLENIISVAAISNQGSLANFSNFGEKSVHLAAPGQNILSTVPGDKYESYSGTSMSTPYVAGAAALVLSKEKLSVSELKNRLIKTTAMMSSLNKKVVSGGRLDIASALTGVPVQEDPYDINKWIQKAVSISSAHPYELGITREYELSEPGAKYIAIRFSKFLIEENYDRVFFLDSQKRLISTWTGNHSNEYSPIVNGDKIYIRFNSDSHIQDYGFDVSSLAFKR